MSIFWQIAIFAGWSLLLFGYFYAVSKRRRADEANSDGSTWDPAWSGFLML